MQAEDGIRDYKVTGVQTCALPICGSGGSWDDGGALSEAASSASQGFDMPGIDGLDEGAVVLVPVLLVFAALLVAVTGAGRSEERRVGKECRSRWSPYHLKKKTNYM